MSDLEVVLVPALSDNYIYLARCTASGTVAVIDPADPDPVIQALADRGWRADLILNTHHHGDHTAGNGALKAHYGIEVTGPTSERGRVPTIDHGVAGGDSVAIGEVAGTVFETPGHTRGHIALWFAEADTLFSGDSLFSLGCGRLFEGTAAQMWRSLLTLRDLPDTARIYCGHEYTWSNARFALSIDGDNDALRAQSAEVDRRRAAGEPTIPAGLGREKATNPFLRADDPALAASLGLAGADPAAVFAEIRRRKDSF